VRHEGGANHESGRDPGIFDTVQVIRVVQVAIEGSKKEAQTGTADREEGQAAFSHKVYHHYADYGADQLCDAQKHRGRVLINGRLQFREYHDSESLQGRRAAEGTDEEDRADQDERQIEGAFGVRSPNRLLVGIRIISRLLNLLAERLKFLPNLRRVHPAS